MPRPPRTPLSPTLIPSPETRPDEKLSRGDSPRARYIYAPFPWQKVLHSVKSKNKIIWAGRRAGKGRAAIQEALSAIDEAAHTPYENHVTHLPDPQNGTPLVPPIHIWTVAPTKAQTLQVWHEMKAFIPEYLVRNSGAGRASGWNNDELSVWLDMRDAAGNWMPGVYRPSIFWELKTADNPEMLQTVGLDFLHLAEAQDIKEIAWNKVRPTLNSPGRLGRAFLEGIPPVSRAHWFSKLFHYAQRNPGPSYFAARATTFDNTALSESQKQEILAERELTLEPIWRRHYLADQPEEGGGFFSNTERAASSELYDTPRPGMRYVAGLDLGMTNDPTVLVVKERSTRRSIFGIEMLKTDWTVQRETIASECARFEVEEVRIDATGLGGLVACDDLAARGVPVVPFKFTPTSKHQLFTHYAIALAKGQVSFPAEWSRLRDQLDGLIVLPIGMSYSFRQVDGGHDDWLDSECLALMACDPAPEESYDGIAVMTRETVAPLRDSGDVPAKRDEVIAWFRSQRRKGYDKPRRPDLVANGEPIFLP